MKAKLKKKVTTTKIVKEVYSLTKDLIYVRVFKNDVLESNTLEYTGKKVNGYQVVPIWKADISFLKQWNPYWGEDTKSGLNKDYSWFITEALPEPEEINIKDIIYVQSASHSFFDINLDPIPVVIAGDYMDASLNNDKYDLIKLKKHFESHKNVVFCSDILNIPSYNAGGGSGTKYLYVLVYPEKKWLKALYKDKKSRRDVFTPTWDEDAQLDFLKMKKFRNKVKVESDNY